MIKELDSMKFTIVGKNIEVTDGLKSAIKDKLGKLERYFTPNTEVAIVFIILLLILTLLNALNKQIALKIFVIK